MCRDLTEKLHIFCPEELKNTTEILRMAYDTIKI